ncbi:hypothetical protein A3C87_02180 [Candidatus Kaiserbacteria bacterium RIFCSPHIGHO2_02_FULL_49_34]|uniref:Uncharacterized protein n=1 Tax=Candidatus Kaiserbacteria bacterium RIFCSPHIGHO2_02_FULL_49_34 TaxID=1798491 RepID=A0A1F6DL06_9BACT|nr:MAG: hypothetical protein A3C87_02180 [Candidatus Kaiserbacteria bacterium RIFCSPHIGHO2_02_FULL_49_34]
MQKKNIFLALIAVTFLLIVGIVIRYTTAADVSTSATIENAPPTIDEIRFSQTEYGTSDFPSGINLSVGTDTPLHIAGIITDLNGDGDIATTSVVFFRSGVTSSCTEDKNNCYKVDVCAVDTSYGDDTQAQFNCPVSLAFWTDATDTAGRFNTEVWQALATVSDNAGNEHSLIADTSVNSLLALNLPEGIDYGTRSLGEESTAANNVEYILTQRGNTKADVEVKGATMSCSVLGKLATTTQAYALTDVGHVSSVTLTDVFTPVDVNVEYRDDDNAESTKPLYWNIKIPPTGVKGFCTGSNTIVIIADAPGLGTLYDGKLSNVAYSSPTYSGRTNAAGRFSYAADETMTFSIGAVTLGAIDTNDIPVDQNLMIHDLVGTAYTNTTDTALVQMARFLQSTGGVSGGIISIPEQAHTSFTTPLTFATVSDSTLQTELTKISKSLIAAFPARQHVAQTIQSLGKATFPETTVTLNADELLVDMLGSTGLAWTSENAEVCSGVGTSTSGSQSTGSLATSTTYIISCEGLLGSATKSITVSVAPTRAVRIGVGYHHTFITKADGTLWTWGSNDAGQLGLGDTTARTSPTQVGIDTNWQYVTGGASVTSSLGFSIGIKQDGTLRAWGYNAEGQLGLGDTTNRSTRTQVGTETNWKSVVAGTAHVAALKTDGTLWVWGWNSSGQLGLGDTTNRSTPTQIGTATDWKSVVTGNVHTLAIKTDGTLYAWGGNTSGQLGLGDTSNRSTPTQIGSETDWVSVGIGGSFSFARKADGTLWGWGLNGNYQLGLGEGNNSNELSPVQIGSATDWQNVVGAIGGGFMVATKQDGSMWSWGINDNGRTGLGTSTGYAYVPTQIGTETTWSPYIAAAGGRFAIAVRQDNTVWVWGKNDTGQLGLGDTEDKLVPTQHTNFLTKIKSLQKFTLANIFNIFTR